MIDPTAIPDHVEQNLVAADPRTCPGCGSTRSEDLDGRLYCDTTDCTWASGDRAARIADYYDRIHEIGGDDLHYALHDGWV